MKRISFLMKLIDLIVFISDRVQEVVIAEAAADRIHRDLAVDHVIAEAAEVI